MLESYAIYRDYQKAMQYQEQQREQTACEPEEIEGFKLLFPEEEKTFVIEPESEEDFKVSEKFTSEPETPAQLAHLEKYGYFYK